MMPISFQGRDVSAPASNTAAIVTYGAIAGRAHVIEGLIFSYDVAPTGGSIKIEDGSGNVVFGPHAITASGPGPLDIGQRQGAMGTALIITLAAAGVGVSGALTILGHRTTPNAPISIAQDFFGFGMMNLGDRASSIAVAAIQGGAWM